MRLLKLDGDELSLTEFFGKNVPPYAILSNTWGVEEVTFKDVSKGTYRNKPAYNTKIRFCAMQAAVDGLRYFWIDTCCIDKSSSAELSEAINSMFSWYRKAQKCYVSLSDFPDPKGRSMSKKRRYGQCKWFTRGWTLQVNTHVLASH